MGLTQGQTSAVRSINKAKFKKLSPARLVNAIHMFIKAQNKKGRLEVFKITDDSSLREHVNNVAEELGADITHSSFKLAVKKLKAVASFNVKRNCPLFADDKGKKANSEYLGGEANEPHVHVYSGGFHLKLGSDRYNIVQNGKLYESTLKQAHAALKKHALKDTLAPYVAAALKKHDFL